VLQRYQPFYSFLAFYSFMTIAYWGSGLLFILIEQMHWLDAIKIHKGVYNTWDDYSKCFINLFLNYVFIILPVLIPVPLSPLPITFIIFSYVSSLQGWFVLRWIGMSFAVEDFPSLSTFLWHSTASPSFFSPYSLIMILF